MSDGFPHDLAAAMDAGPESMADYLDRHAASEVRRDIKLLYENVIDSKTDYESREAVDRRDYFAAHAPYLPRIIADSWERHVATDEPDAMTMPWNEWVMEKLAVQEARWRRVFADRLIKELDRKIERQTDGRQDQDPVV